MTEQKKKTTKFAVSGDKIFGMEVWQLQAMVPILVVVLFVIMSLGLVVVPKIGQIKDYRSQVSDLKTKIDDLNKKRAYIQSIDEGDLKAKEEVLLMAMPESKDIYYLLNVVTGVVSEYGFMVDGFSFSPGELKEGGEEETASLQGISRVSFDLNLVGPGERYIELIEGLENSLPILSFDEIDSKVVGEAVSTIDLKMTTYFASGKEKVDVSKLAYTDLIMTQSETDLLEDLANYKKIEGLFAVDGGLGGGKTYQEYELKNPFGN